MEERSMLGRGDKTVKDEVEVLLKNTPWVSVSHITKFKFESLFFFSRSKTIQT